MKTFEQYMDEVMSTASTGLASTTNFIGTRLPNAAEDMYDTCGKKKRKNKKLSGSCLFNQYIQRRQQL